MSSEKIKSRVITGLWQIADMERHGTKVNATDAARELKAYADAGLNVFDMADHYGSAEEIVGAFRNNYPDTQATMMTKWVPEPSELSTLGLDGSKKEQFILDKTREAVKKALRRMQSNKIDVMQFHAWHYANPVWLDCLFALQKLTEEGLIERIGVTNFDAAHLNIALKSGINISSNQVCYSLLDQRAAGKMTELCLKENIQLFAFGTVAGGLLSDKWLNQPEPDSKALSNWSLMKYKRFVDQSGGWQKFQKLLTTLAKLSKETGISVAHLASGYILQKPAVGGVIVGARLGESSHLEQNKKLAAISLSAETIKQIDAELVELNSIPGDCGDEYRKPPYLTASGDLSHHLSTLPAPFEVREINKETKVVMTGTIWEPMAGYSRAVMRGNTIHVSGTTATHGSRLIGGDDPGAQTEFVLDKIEGALYSLGFELASVVRTRIFVKHAEDWEPVALAHGRRFGKILPANTMVEAKLIGPEYLVEIEAEVILN
ncbi:MAG: aldo/keto reductase [Bacteroidetes bacterium]|nr:aldo/keto reductase [Bacteroidota bacterium]